MDSTWLPYYQISHLMALQQYFDILGTERISQLSKGKQKPPSDDPQTYIGNIEPRFQVRHKRSSEGKAIQTSQNCSSLPPPPNKWLGQFISNLQLFLNVSHLIFDARHPISLNLAIGQSFYTNPLSQPQKDAIHRMCIPLEKYCKPFSTRQYTLPRNHILDCGCTD